MAFDPKNTIFGISYGNAKILYFKRDYVPYAWDTDKARQRVCMGKYLHNGKPGWKAHMYEGLVNGLSVKELKDAVDSAKKLRHVSSNIDGYYYYRNGHKLKHHLPHDEAQQ